MVKVNESKLVDERIPEINWVDGVEETLQKLKSRGYKLGVVTSDTKRCRTIFDSYECNIIIRYNYFD